MEAWFWDVADMLIVVEEWAAQHAIIERVA
jgi:hypothetical protein